MLPDLVENLSSLVASQYAEADRAICGCGNFILIFVPVTRNVASPSLTGRHYQSSVRLAVFCLINEGVAGTKQSTSTDGNLIVLHRPDAGKKLGSRRQPRADCTVTQNKKRKL